MSDRKTAAIANILVRYFSVKPKNILVVGCGSGIEAAILAQSFGARVVGIDIVDNFHAAAKSAVTLQVADATAMPFSDREFDFVYSYHALEHIPDYKKALGEMRRVLKPLGGWCVGTPNRARLVGYLGSKDATLREKFLWNAADWKMRVRGQFRNECGAHAGYTAEELSMVLEAAFGRTVDITADYYNEIYPRHNRVLSLLRKLRVAPFLLPSVYFAGIVA